MSCDTSNPEWSVLDVGTFGSGRGAHKCRSATLEAGSEDRTELLDLDLQPRFTKEMAKFRLPTLGPGWA